MRLSDQGKIWTKRKINKETTNSVALSPQANYTD
jgi:hypothetical protein